MHRRLVLLTAGLILAVAALAVGGALIARDGDGSVALAQSGPVQRPTQPARTPGPGPRPTRQVPTPGPASPASNVEVTVYGNTVTWRTIPSAMVRLEIRNAGGTLTGSGNAMADDQGRVTITLAGGGGGIGRGAAALAIRPGDEVRLIPTGGTTVAVKVPDLAVGAAVADNEVVGRSPAGTTLQLEVLYGADPATSTFTQAVTPDASGAFDVPLADPVRLAPGVSGRVILDTPESNRFIATFNVLEAEVTLGARQVTGRATLGSTVAVSLAGSAGQAKGSSSLALVGNPNWTQPAGAGGGRPGAFGRVAAGDTLSVTQRSSLPGTTYTLSGVVPDLTVDVDLPANRVEGTAPANAPVTIELRSPYDEITVRETTAGADGNYSVDLSGVTGFGRGWRAVARTPIVPGLRVAAIQVINQVRIGIHRSIVNGVAEPGTVLTVTVRGADGTVKGSDSTQANNQGAYETAFAGAARIAIGDTIEVEFVGGDPVVVPVLPVSAMTDAEQDTVSGVAPAGTRVRVSRGTGSTQTVINTTADNVGNYRASFAGVLDLVAPMNGDVVVRLASGHELFTGWAAVRMTMEIRAPFLTGNGPVGRAVSAELVAADGGIVATGEATIGGGGGGPGLAGGAQWNLEFEDSLAAPVDIEVGDTVRVTVGDDSFTVVVPPLSGVAFVAGDIVNGRTTANRALTLRVQRTFTGETTSVDLVADGGGTFSHDFSGTFDLQHNDAILFTTLETGHIVNSRIAVPGLRLDLDLGILVGSWRPNAQVAYELRGTGGVKSDGTVRAGDDAVFTVMLVNGAGERAIPAVGDRLTVEPLEGEPDAPLELVVPELTITHDVETNAMGGRAVPGGGLIFTARDVLERQQGGGPAQRRSEPTIDTAGTYTVRFMPVYDVVPGTQMQALYRLPTGHLVQRTRYAPLLNVQYGGANVCGFTLPREEVAARLAGADGATLAEGREQAGYDSRYVLQLRNTAGETAVTAEGQTISATLDGKPVSVKLPPLTISVDWSTGRVTGTAPATTIFQVLRPARGCLDTAPRQSQPGMVGRNGQFALNVPGLDPGQGFEIAFLTAEGHRYYRHVFRSLAQIYVHTDLVTGRTTPSTPVTIVLTDAAGTERGRATTVATPNGFYLARLVNGAGQPVSSEPGDKVRLEASGENPEIVVEELRFDWSPGDAIIGTAPADREVRVTVTLASGGSASFTLQADAAGAFSFRAQDVPPRSAWGLDDITAVRTVIDTPNGHQIVSDTAPPTEPGPIDPPDRDNRIFLPRTQRHGLT